MLFNTFHFAYFFAILLPLYWALPHRWQNYLLLAASYYFYSCWVVPGAPPTALPRALIANHVFQFFWSRRFLSLLVLSTAMDFACGLAVDRIENPRKRKLFVALSMALNLGMLGYFKYFNFFAESFQVALQRAGLHVSMTQLNVVLPIGISFYTFQSMSYVIDVYRKHIKPTQEPPGVRDVRLVLPAPGCRADHEADDSPSADPAAAQGNSIPRPDLSGSLPDLLGPDQEGRHRRQPRSDRQRHLRPLGRRSTAGLRLLAIYAFAFQIYCDFSGYTDAARGIAKCLGIELALNFNLPYFATSPQEFWTSLAHQPLEVVAAITSTSRSAAVEARR